MKGGEAREKRRGGMIERVGETGGREDGKERRERG
jgi:hypothetical protein